MKKFFLASILIVASCSLKAQAYKFRVYNGATFCQYQDPEYNNKMNILLVIDITKMRLDVYLANKASYDLIRKKNSYTDSEGDMHTTYSSVDNDGGECETEIILFKYYKNSGQTGFITIKYSNCNICYRLKPNE